MIHSVEQARHTYSGRTLATNARTAVEQLARYAVTAAYLRPRQVCHRITSVLRRRVLHPSRKYRAWYMRRATRIAGFKPIVFPDVQCFSFNIAEIENGTFTFLNRKVHLGKPVDWFPNHEVRLWLYNLHYWHYATTLGCELARSGNERAYGVFRRLAREWIAACPVASPIAWDAYPMSLRMANWFRAYSLFALRLDEDRSFASELHQSLYVQASFLEKHLEYDLLNNHLLENGRSLLLAGLFFAGRDANRWLRTGERILMTGLEETFLADGGHDERSPMYHQAMLEMYDEVTEVLEANGQPVPQLLSDRLRDLRDWLGAVCHPDGEFALLNDSAFGFVRPTREVVDQAGASGDGLRALDASGYYTFRDRDNGHFLIFDCGPLGPEHQLAHGHCDTLSFELSVSGDVVSAPIGPLHPTAGEVRRGDAVLQILPWGEHGVETYFGNLDPIQGWYAPEFGLHQQNHVWGISHKGELPARMGYVLWPEPTVPTVHAEPTSDGSYRVTIQDDSDIYRVCIEDHNVTLELSE